MRKVFASIPGRTTTAASLTNSQTGLVSGLLTSATGFQASGPFVLVFEPGTANEEWVLCDTRSGTAVTINSSGRGFVNAAVAHASGVQVHALGVDYLTVDEFNRAVNLLTTKGDLLGFDGSLYQRVPAGTVDGQLLRKLVANGTGLEWNTLGGWPVGAVAGPVDGQGWYQASGSETEGLLLYDGTTPYPPWNMKWGLVGQPGFQPSSQTISTPGADVTGMSVTFTAVNRRWYRYTILLDIDNNSSIGNVNTGIELRDGSNSTLQAWTLVTQGGGSPANMHHYCKRLIRQESPGLVTRKVWSNGVSVSGMRFGAFTPVILGQLWAEDFGPVTGAPT